MKNILKLCLLLIAVGWASVGFGQNICSTSSNNIDSLQLIPQNEFRVGQNSYVIRIFLHIIRKTDGTGGQTLQEINTALNYLNLDYGPHNICFSLLGIDYINNDNLYFNYSESGLDKNNDGKFDNLNINSHFNAIDIYLFSNNGAQIGGIAAGIPGKAMALGGNVYSTNLASSRVISHEMGHCLGLFHTFHGSSCESANNSCAELVNGSNSNTCGDFVNDTPADPSRFGVNQSSCVYNGEFCSGGSNKDANGQTYTPNMTLIMSYTTPNCMQSHTPNQGQRIRNTIANSNWLQSVVVPQNITYNNLSIETSQNFLYDVQSSISLKSNNKILSNGNLILRAGENISIEPNFEAAFGSTLILQIERTCGTIDVTNSARTGFFDVSIISEPSSLQPYPNPISEGILNFGKVAETYNLYNSQGVLISQGQNVDGVNVDNLESGIYLIIVDGLTSKISIE